MAWSHFDIQKKISYNVDIALIMQRRFYNQIEKTFRKSLLNDFAKRL